MRFSLAKASAGSSVPRLDPCGRTGHPVSHPFRCICIGKFVAHGRGNNTGIGDDHLHLLKTQTLKAFDFAVEFVKRVVNPDAVIFHGIRRANNAFQNPEAFAVRLPSDARSCILPAPALRAHGARDRRRRRLTRRTLHHPSALSPEKCRPLIVASICSASERLIAPRPVPQVSDSLLPAG